MVELNDTFKENYSMSNELHVSPVGTAVYPWLNKPDTKFDADGVYSVKMVYSKADVKSINAVVKPLMNGGKNNPIKPEVDDQGETTGNYVVQFKLKAKVSPKRGEPFSQKPVLFDENGNRLTKLIGGGSQLKIAYEAFAYDGMGGGVSLRCKKVRVAEGGLVEYQSKENVDWGDDCVDKPELAEEEAKKDYEADEMVEEEDEDF